MQENDKKIIKDAFCGLAQVVKDNMMSLPIGEEVDVMKFRTALDAYNVYQEDERCGADYIFDITNQGDLETLVRGGTTAQEIAEMVHAGFTLFHVGENYPKPVPMSQIDAYMEIVGHSETLTRRALLHQQLPPYNEFIRAFLLDPIMFEGKLYKELTED